MERTRGRPARFDRDQVLAAATTLFAEHGFEGTSLGELVAAIGCTPPSLYNYFKSKEELYLAVLDRYWSRDVATLPHLGRARKVLEDYVAASLARFTPEQGPRGCLVLTGGFREAAGHQALKDILQSKRAESFSTLVALTTAMQSQGDLDPTLDPEAWSRSLFALVQGLALQAMDGVGRAELQAAFDMFLGRFPATVSGPPSKSEPTEP